MAGGGRNSLPSGPRHTLRRPRSISEPRESNFYASAPPTGIVGGFVDPFSSTRRSLDYRSSSMDGDTIAPGSSDPYIYRRPDTGNSPFGPGVIYTEPAAPASPEMPTFATNPSLREMQSFESNLTAKPDPIPPAKFYATSQMLMKKDSILTAASRETTPFSTIVFDILQTFRGAPLPDRLSESSSEPTVKLSSSSSAVPRDDPRFVIWGEVYSNVFEEQTTSQGSHTDLSISSHSGVSPRRKTSRARSGDVPIIFNSSSPERLIVAATIERWIAQLTSENESFELVHFFITYRIYISGVDLCHLLICRFHWALEKPNSKPDEVIRAQVRARTYKMIRYWLSHWFKVDFSTNPQLCQVLINWVNTLRKDPVMTKLSDALVSGKTLEA
jgi:Gdp/GTP exchange factor required for growth at low temperatures